jgi:hypothetical protein
MISSYFSWRAVNVKWTVISYLMSTEERNIPIDRGGDTACVIEA